ILLLRNLRHSIVESPTQANLLWRKRYAPASVTPGSSWNERHSRPLRRREAGYVHQPEDLANRTLAGDSGDRRHAAQADSRICQPGRSPRGVEASTKLKARQRDSVDRIALALSP